MNYLAHAYFSFENDEIIVGNLISDFVKGRKKLDYPCEIQKGITLHRSIDEFTDNHRVTKEAKEIFRPAYRLYSGAFIDVVYDHFLAIDKNEFTDKSLFAFSQKIYASVEKYSAWLPEKFGKMFIYMRNQNWLYGYREREMIRNSFTGLVRRSVYLTESDTAFDLFEKHYDELAAFYGEFIRAIKPFAKQRFEELRTS